jgi:hypothetical protein
MVVMEVGELFHEHAIHDERAHDILRSAYAISEPAIGKLYKEREGHAGKFGFLIRDRV